MNGHQFSDYEQMSHLPWCSPPVDNLPQCRRLKEMYPRQSYAIANFPSSTQCPIGVRPYWTGMSENPNTTSVWLWYHNNLSVQDTEPDDVLTMNAYYTLANQ